MADRIALAIEPDNDTAKQIRRLLEPKGFQVEHIPNGDDAMEWGRSNKPAVIILSVEPRKVGYAISNKDSNFFVICRNCIFKQGTQFFV